MLIAKGEEHSCDSLIVMIGICEGDKAQLSLENAFPSSWHSKVDLSSFEVSFQKMLDQLAQFST